MRKMRWDHVRFTAGVLASLVGVSLTGCGGGNVNAGSSSGPPVTAPVTAPTGTIDYKQSQPHQGLSTKQKVLLLAGAAAVYYLYKRHQNAQGEGAQGKYYRSKNGQVYYRDAKGGVHWVTEPTQPIQVPADEYERYTGQSANYGNGQVIRQAPAGW